MVPISDNVADGSSARARAPSYDGPDRRGLSQEQIAVMISEAYDVRFAKTTEEIKDHMDEQFGKMRESIREAINDHVDAAFPNRELHKHREFHQGKIDAAATAKRLRDDIYIWAVKGVIGVILLLLGLGLLEYARGVLTRGKP